MTSIFLSHSSHDKALARKIANQLVKAGIRVWLDEWEILVGDSITQAIEKGLEETDFVAVLITQQSVGSGWVAKEWQSRVGKEATNRNVQILPLKADNCQMPTLLSDKRFADFRSDFKVGMNQLLDAIQGHTLRHKPMQLSKDQTKSQNRKVHKSKIKIRRNKNTDEKSQVLTISTESFLKQLKGFSMDIYKIDFIKTISHRLIDPISFNELDNLLSQFSMDIYKIRVIKLLKSNINIPFLSEKELERYLSHFSMDIYKRNALELLI